MKKTTVLVGLFLLLAVAVSAVLLLFPRAQEGTLARISLDGEVVRQLDLSRITAPERFTLTGKSGLTNTITVEPGRICVSHADCPDQICVHQGYIDNGTVPIVCLPNRLVIEIIGGGGLDAATG